ncbi:DUF1254 domain-containing protein [Streptomyces sp. HD1123-B1]|uniref:DUF1254 domain-containing protein n=1 Tax=Streptomyces huangiella TaxID=3228804 RepID=UPI003D7C5334
MKYLTKVAAAVVAGVLLVPAAASADSQGGKGCDYRTGYALGQRAYDYGLPLLDTERLFQTSTSVNSSDGSGNGPVNQFNHLPKLVVPKPDQQSVVAPNADTLYSLAWLDLSDEPQVIHVPAIKNRFYVMEMLTPWTENFYNITSHDGPRDKGTHRLTRGGDFAVVPPGYTGDLPAGVHRIESPYKRVWVLGRTLIRGASDTPAVNAIQKRYTVTPLSRYGRPRTPPKPSPPDTTLNIATVPGTKPGDDPLTFYTALGRELRTFKPMPGDRRLLKRLKRIGVGPGMDPARSHRLSAATLRGMRDAVAQGRRHIDDVVKRMYAASAPAHNGYLVTNTGAYGTDYRRRAVVDQIGLGAPLSHISVYPFARTDKQSRPLSGAHRYVLHIPAGQMPPVKGFWSLTMYDKDGFFVPNPIDRYVLNDRSDLHRNSDGSIDLYIQHDEPTDKAERKNWLPAPEDGFSLMWRLYGPSPDALPGLLDGTGWQPPAIERATPGPQS